MTETEMALAIGTLLIRREIRNAALAAELEMYRTFPDWQHVPWRANVQRTIDSPELSHDAALRIAELRNELEGANPDDSLVRILHHFLLAE